MRIKLVINWEIVTILSVAATIVSAFAACLIVLAPIFGGLLFMESFGQSMLPVAIKNDGKAMFVAALILMIAAMVGLYGGGYFWYRDHAIAALQTGTFVVTCIVVWCRKVYTSGVTEA